MWRSAFLGVLVLAAGVAYAHHSAPVFYKVDERVTVSGTVTEFRFSNPHAILKLANELADRDRRAAACRVIDVLIAAEPDHAEALSLRARL